MKNLLNHIDGAWVPGRGSDRLDAVSPLNGATIATFPASDAVDVDAAVASASIAQLAWAALPLEDRLSQLAAFADAIEGRAQDIAEAEHREMGKPVDVALQFIAMGLAAFRGALLDARTYAFTSRKEGPTGTTEVQRVPVGVIAEIVPWNFTVPQILLNLGALLAAGNAVIVKPSEKATPSAVALFEQSSLPPGVFNLVLGDGRAGRALAEHAGVGMVLFTGSVATGRSVASAAGNNLNRVILELGGKDAAIIDADVDVEAVAMEVAAGCYINSGQICTSMERIYVHADVAEAFTDALLRATDVFAEGGPMAIGPLVDEGQAAIVAAHVDDAVSHGATVLRGGRASSDRGTYYPPTVITDVTADMVIAREETFGPVAPLFIVSSFEEALDQACDSDFGLAATVYSANPDSIAAARRRMEVATLWVNKWQGSDGLRESEPYGISGMGAVGGRLSFDGATRPMTVFIPQESPVQ